MNVVRFARRRGKMEMINGEKKLHVWLYKYEQDGVSPVLKWMDRGKKWNIQ